MKKITSQEIKGFVSKLLFDEKIILSKDPSYPKISIVTPSYNQAQFLERTILSVLNQNYPNLEYIIIDGGSTDGSVDIVKKYEKYLSYWVSKKDKGQSDAINKGFAKSSGEIVAWLNSDDVYINKEAISLVVKTFEKYPDADVVTANGMIIDEKDKWVQPIILKRERLCYKHLKWSDSILQPATFFKRKVIEDLLCDITLHYAFDWDLFIRMIEKYNFFPLDEIISGYRIYESNKTTSGGLKRVDEIVEVIKRYCGKSSLQYWSILFFYIPFKIVDIFPFSVRIFFQKKIAILSSIINLLSFNRIPSI